MSRFIACDRLRVMSDTYAVEFRGELRTLLEAEAKEHGFATVAEYLEVLVRANTPVEFEDDPDLEAALLEGIRSGPGIVADDAYWADLHHRCREAAKTARRRD
jgi:hypothetical protein